MNREAEIRFVHNHGIIDMVPHNVSGKIKFYPKYDIAPIPPKGLECDMCGKTDKDAYIWDFGPDGMECEDCHEASHEMFDID